MAIKTFTTGEVLTAADTNTYLANSGLVYISSTTIGSAVSSVTVSGAFSTTYDNYKIVMSGGTCSVSSTNIVLQLGAKTTNYKSALVYNSWANTPLAVGSTTATGMIFAGNGQTSGNTMNVELISPFTATNTYATGSWQATTDGGFSIMQTADTTSYTAFTIAPASATITGGTITVYGYRKA